MKAFDPNYKLLDEMYQDNYYPAFLVDKVKDELQKVIDLLENGETDTEVVQETLDSRAARADARRNALSGWAGYGDRRDHAGRELLHHVQAHDYQRGHRAGCYPPG